MWADGLIVGLMGVAVMRQYCLCLWVRFGLCLWVRLELPLFVPLGLCLSVRFIRRSFFWNCVFIPLHNILWWTWRPRPVWTLPLTYDTSPTHTKRFPSFMPIDNALSINKPGESAIFRYYCLLTTIWDMAILAESLSGKNFYPHCLEHLMSWSVTFCYLRIIVAVVTLSSHTSWKSTSASRYGHGTSSHSSSNTVSPSFAQTL
jgi:hypothetical protein